MKGLLHSKRFKKNLQKWLFMYVGVMTLLTSVITYSKYMAKVQMGDDSAKVGKFQVGIKQVSCSDYIDSGITCDALSSGNGCRPTQVVASCFEVDTSELEIESDLLLTFDPALKDSSRDDGFYSPNMKNINNDDILINIEGIDIISENKDTEIYPSTSINWKSSTDNLRLRLERRVDAEKGAKWIIRVRMKKSNESSSFPNQVRSTKLVKVGYSMIQVVE